MPRKSVRKIPTKGEKKELQSQWLETVTDVETVDWKGNVIIVKEVRAQKNASSGTITVRPEELAKAEVIATAKKLGIEPRDVPLLLLVLSKPGPFLEGQIPLKYRLNKTLFYYWKELEKEGLGEALPHDSFIAADRGPMPEHITDDLQRLKEKSLVNLKYTRWGKGPRDESLTVELTPEGTKLAKELSSALAESFVQTAKKIKERIFPLDPSTIRNRVHREYPQYKKNYTELDTD